MRGMVALSRWRSLKIMRRGCSRLHPMVLFVSYTDIHPKLIFLPRPGQ
jgi:hypothetical protein